MKQINGYPGFYIVFEGIVGAGKSTQINLLKEKLLINYPTIPVVYTREPGGTKRGEEIRDIVKNRKISPINEAKLFVEARKLTLDQVVRPALTRGELVISDRSFISSLAYQGFGCGLGMEKVWRVNKNVVCTTFPDCIAYLDGGLEASVVRSGRIEPDKFDTQNLEYWEKTKKGYDEALKKLKETNPETLIIQVKDERGILSEEETFVKVWETLATALDVWLENPEGKILRERASGGSRREICR